MNAALRSAAVLSTALLAAGCSALDQNIQRREAPVNAVTVGEAADVTALDLARAMLQAGFSREEILEHGPAVRNALATSGAAQIADGDSVLALMSVLGDKLYITSRSRGTFVYGLSS